MIIIEGPDGSGKSTLIRSLHHKGKCLKALRGGVGGTQRDGSGDGTAGWAGVDPALVAYTRQVLTAAEDTAFDRFHLSEYVYGPLLRQKQELSEGDLHMLSIFLRDRHVPIILCLPPFSVTWRNVTQEGRERPSYQTEAFLHQAYRAFEQLAPWATMVYDYTHDALPVIPQRASA
jgi:hypothetical protein